MQGYQINREILRNDSFVARFFFLIPILVYVFQTGFPPIINYCVTMCALKTYLSAYVLYNMQNIGCEKLYVH